MDREEESCATSTISGITSAQASRLYWGTGTSAPSGSTRSSIGHDYPYPSPLHEPSLPSSTGLHHGRQSESSNPTIDFSGLIPMFPEAGSPNMSSRSQLPHLPYENAWPTSDVAEYETFQRSNSSPWHLSSNAQPLHQQWNSSSGDGSLAQQFNEYVPYFPPSPYSCSRSSSPRPSYSSPTRRNHAIKDDPNKSCSHCHVTSTPLWRRDPSTKHTLCNACGLYLQQRNKLRPQQLIDADIDDGTPEIPDADYSGPKCSHCSTRRTSVWRRSKTGEQVCNACGVYARLRGKPRPLSLRRNKIKPRTKHSR